MKKLFRLLCAFAAIASFAVACDEPVPEDTTVTLTASFAPLTRTTIDDELTPAWEKGDLLYASDGAVLVSAAVADADNGKKVASFDFEGLATNYGAEGVSYYALYGGSVTRTDATHYSFGLTNDGSWKAAHAAVGKAANGNVTLKSITSAVSFKTSGREITSVTLSGLAETDKFPTKVTADVTSTPLVTVESAATLTAAVNKKAGVYYFGFFPVENISGLKVTVNYEGGDVKEILFRETYSFTAGKIVELGNIDEKEDNSKVVLTAGFGPKDGGVEATYSDNDRLIWAKGDLLYASDGTTLASAAVTDADNGQSTATFTYPTLDYEATDYYGIYAGAGTVEQGDATHFTIAMASDGTWGNAHVALGKAVDNDIRLTPLSTGVAFETAGENITTVTLTGLGEADKFPTKVTVGVSDTAPVTEASAETLTVAVNKKAGLYYFGFFPVENLGGLKVTVNYEGGNVKEILLKEACDFAAGDILELGNIDEKPDNSKVILTAGFGANGAIGAEGTFYTESGTLAWAKGDLLYASDGTTLASAAVEDADNGKSTATFTYTGLDYDATDYYGIYAGAGTVEQKDATHFTIAVAPDGTWGNAQVAFGKAAENDIRLSTLSTGVAFTIAGTDIASVTLSGLIEDDEFPTKATLNTADKTFVNEDAVTSLTANVGGKAGTYYLGFFPVEGISGLKLTANYGAGEPKSVIFKEAFNFKTGDVLDLGKLDPLFGKTFCTVEKKDFEAVSGTIEGGFKYTSYKGFSSTAPYLASGGIIRLYQAANGSTTGGYIVIESNGDMMTEVHLDITNNTTYLYSVGDDPVTEAAANVTAANGITISDIETDRVVVYCGGTDSNTRLNIKAIRIKYLLDDRTVQTLSFPEASYTALMGTPFEAPVLSGAQTAVTYRSSNTAVATVDASTGAVTLMGAGTTTISVKAAADDTYKQARASYDLTVANPVEGIAGIKQAINNTTSTPFVATLTGAIVTKVQAEYPYACYIEQGNDAILLYNAFGNKATDLKEGDRIDGLVSGAGIFYNSAYLEVTAFDYSKATITPGQEIPTVYTTVANLKNAFSRYEYRRVKVEDAIVTDALTTTDQDGAIAVGQDTVILRAQVKNTIAVEKDATVDVTGWATYYYNSSTKTKTNQLGIWAQSDIIVKGGEGRIEMDAKKNLAVGDTWTIGATCNSGATITYTSDKTDVAEVDPATGVVTAKAVGSATITATAPAANNFTAAEATCIVTVSEPGNVVTLQYTLDGTITGGSSNYAEASVITQNEIQWKVVGNTTMSPWRIGGKNLTNADREVYSQTAISSNISKIEIEHGTQNLSAINSMTVTVHSTAEEAAKGSNAIATFTPTFVAEGTVTIEKADETSWANCFYRIVYNVNAPSSNKFLQLKSVKFYGL